MQKAQIVDTALFDEWLDKSGLKIGFLANKMGVSRQAFDKKRKGLTSVRKSEIYVICDLLRLPEDVAQKIFLPRG
jgi:hypothetical protein